jgi:tetratricopeptide (TPR) repeat protein
LLAMKRASLLPVAQLTVVCVILAAAAACAPGNPPPPTDEFATVTQQADQAYQRGLELYNRGKYREALDAFEQAQLLSPTRDERVADMVERLRVQLSPTPIPSRPEPTATAVPTAVAQNTATPAADLGQAYFGQVYLAIVPGHETVPPPMHEFSAQDQIALYVEKLDERLRLPWKLRVFDVGNTELIAETGADTTGAAPSPAAPSPAVDSPPRPTPTPSLVRFSSNLVWYHAGPESPGNYRVELYARAAGAEGDVLTHAIEYVVGTRPVPIPTSSPATEPLGSPQPAPVPLPPPAVVPAPPPPQPAAAVPAPQVQPVPMPRPTAPAPPQVPASPSPAPAMANSIQVKGTPAALDVVDDSNLLYVADNSGLVWRFENAQPALTRPMSVSGEPRGLAVDQSIGRLYVSVRSPPRVLVLDSTTGQQLGATSVAGEPGDVRLDASLGLLYVLLPQADALEMLDVRDLTSVEITTGLPNVTGMALDATAHTLYLSHLSGELSLVDGRTGRPTDRFKMTDAGLAGVVTTGAQVFAINPPGHELIALDVATRSARRFQLAGEPSSLAVSSQTGAVYVLQSAARSVVRLDPANGTQVGEVLLADGAQQTGGSPSLQPDELWKLPRMAINSADETIYLIEPDTGLLSSATPELFTRAD